MIVEIREEIALGDDAPRGLVEKPDERALESHVVRRQLGQRGIAGLCSFLVGVGEGDGRLGIFEQSETVLFSIAEALGCSVSDLLPGEGGELAPDVIATAKLLSVMDPEIRNAM
ncbi:MAG TPA: hypothetical protein VLS89_15960, partial [Candidatus Nanopelagicales bacterium]|nr:hypothetical protein [Candidatus Nanopelagicales bacterium]